MTIVDQNGYQPTKGDLSIQEVLPDHFNIRWYDGRRWKRLGGSSEQKVQDLIAAPVFDHGRWAL